MAGRSGRRDAGLSRGLGPASAVARILFSSSLWPCPPRLTADRETALGLCHLPLPSAAAQASDEGQVLGGKGLGCLAVGGFTRGAGRLAGSALQVESKVTM
ncbi:AN1-type zinc finger protein 2A isoform X7 [Balaenoptera musculus]|uniref:AN1-type zinc finger protein 2A isoform X7 n=1 Tax=Balaenoptera musculus TaxID=9771 RepID=A0A8B8VBL1_BALMU|nr:AN1-type zinc finger protein 2A isoform X7 [Balaenoptera musculus]